MEAYPVSTPPYVSIACTVHEWKRGWTQDGMPSGINKNVQNGDNAISIPYGFVHRRFNTYGCLWTAENVQWFINNMPVASAPIGAGTPFPSAATDAMYLVLGTGQNWPITIEYVRVWQ